MNNKTIIQIQKPVPPEKSCQMRKAQILLPHHNLDFNFVCRITVWFSLMFCLPHSTLWKAKSMSVFPPSPSKMKSPVNICWTDEGMKAPFHQAWRKLSLSSHTTIWSCTDCVVIYPCHMIGDWWLLHLCPVSKVNDWLEGFTLIDYIGVVLWLRFAWFQEAESLESRFVQWMSHSISRRTAKQFCPFV